MFHKIIQLLKRLLPGSVKQKIKKLMGLEASSISLYSRRIATDSTKINIAVQCGGGIGDFIVYKAIFDQLLEMCGGHIYVFTLSYVNAGMVLTEYKDLSIYYPFYSITDEDYDLHISVDHWIEVNGHNAAKIKKMAPKLYNAVGAIMSANDSGHFEHSYFLLTRNAIIYRAKVMGLNRWTTLSYGNVFDMGSMRSEIPVDEARMPFLSQYGLENIDYITVQYGADRDMGGDRQVKVWPLYRYEEFVKLFKEKYPHIRIVQISANTEPAINGVDVLVKNADLENIKIVLKYAQAHVSGEGGMAHLATQMDTRCVVLFGPTPVHYYGYPTNVNVVSPTCSECMEATEDWAVSCTRKYKKPICMDAITGEMVLVAVNKIFEDAEGKS